MPRPDDRKPGQLRPLSFKRKYTGSAPGSVLVKAGRTTVLCTCTVDPKVPEWMAGRGKGWMTAEYGMLPGSTGTRKPRDKAGKIDGRTVEIQRLIGRSLRAVVDLTKLGERTLWIDCDVLEADGGTRTASITGAFVAVVDALTSVKKTLPAGIDEILTDSVAAISVGVVDGEERLDLEYVEDRDAEVDANLVMTGTGKFIEVQGSGEEATFTRAQLDALLGLGEAGIRAVTAAQKAALGKAWPF
ncbi:ribonuclease ph : Ribonuclease PH OS=Pirellula staleyi (strain ATCC 27377 / DSM 6068 / ICPB 4128) GN=rph PE=3 SV=1: RNase_PH: RNase_PH_C [Gemmataceae bacterium]|nr:ribonuclease ph : Ribonuclease PH OS=Pirellula staleyi (strain ATCC 27377 / DSM 6068 / ICPB 4128) GN=rph PE=3 SV=1: RNase_PH: RNase_PH_C [Gemmataceae bacterium]VTT98615.1 ribonuclease ph : Ribonuclease PH OS=Pirellula staleyi (strain ATCC 27377 / DSM 6068 / ICPB 4128) GN=rph PE=3 SV=1: RNase_PH: RNase_PH_C [Gemmataceae bacterium]